MRLMQSKILLSILFYALIGGFVIPANLSLVKAEEPVTSPITAPVTAPINNNSNNNDSSGNESVNTSVCVDAKPAGTPKLISASATGRNEVTLVWTKASDPVTYYLVAYGTKSGQLEYGNPNVGGKETTNYTVKNLENGKTYYFKVRAGNNCMPGDFSNELSVKVTGTHVNNKNAEGFKAGVLGSNQKEELDFKPITSVKSDRITKSSANFLTRVFDFVKHLFGR